MRTIVSGGPSPSGGCKSRWCYRWKQIALIDGSYCLYWTGYLKSVRLFKDQSFNEPCGHSKLHKTDRQTVRHRKLERWIEYPTLKSWFLLSTSPVWAARWESTKQNVELWNLKRIATPPLFPIFPADCNNLHRWLIIQITSLQSMAVWSW